MTSTDDHENTDDPAGSNVPTSGGTETDGSGETEAGAETGAVAETGPAAETSAAAEAGADGDPVLELRDVTSGYGDVKVLDELSMHVEHEEIVCLIGPNGAGKSTVLKTVFGLLEPWTGTVRFRGEDLRGMAPEDVVREGIGYVPQTENVFGSLSVEENLRMGGVAREEGLEDVIEELYDRFPIIDEKRGAKARTLSGGQRQVLAFARALVMEPDVLLVDEPSAGLAPNTAEEVFDDVEAVNDLGTAILMVEQNATAGLEISDRGYVLDQGRVAYQGEASSLLDDPEVSRLYLGG